MMRGIAKLCIVLLIAGVACVRADPDPRFTPAWEPIDFTGEGWERSKKALIVSDCQLHNLLSLPVPERNLSIEAAVTTAIRPPQLDLFSADVLEWVLANAAPEAEVVLHLGDALNVACDGEFDAFLRVMDSASVPWFMLPGNHDAFYMGNFDPQRRELWEAGCNAAGEPVNKSRFIRLYVAALLQQAKDPGCQALHAAVGIEFPPDANRYTVIGKIPAEFEWKAEDDAPGFLRRIAWSINEKEPWKSYIVQSIDVSDGPFKVRVLMLDTCQYGRRPVLLPNGWASYPVAHNCGLVGELLPDQLRKIRSWVDEWSTFGNSYVLMGHHPFEHIAPRSRSAIGWLWRERRIGMMVTAHTHKGYIAHHDLGGAVDEIEINIGSTTDWPMEWRILQGHIHPEKRQLYLEARRGLLVDVLRKRGDFFEPGWELPRDAPDDYRKYKQGESGSGLLVDFYLGYHMSPYWLRQPRIKPNRAAKDTEEQVKDTLLWTYFRLIKNFPTRVSPDDPDAAQPKWPRAFSNDSALLDKIVIEATRKRAIERKIDFLKELELFERTRHSYDPKTGESTDLIRAHFKISQAAWAARYESADGRRLSVEDEVIRIDWERSIRGREIDAEQRAEKEAEARKAASK